MINILLLGMLANIALQCSPLPGWVKPTVSEQVSLAGAVFKGTVLSVSGNQAKGFVVRYHNVEYFKGCGHSIVSVHGYSSTSLCGVNPPAVGSVNFVFACKGDDWQLNKFTMHAGSLAHTAEIQKEVAHATRDELQCSNCCYLFYKCKTRSEVVGLPAVTSK